MTRGGWIVGGFLLVTTAASVAWWYTSRQPAPEERAGGSSRQAEIGTSASGSDWKSALQTPADGKSALQTPAALASLPGLEELSPQDVARLLREEAVTMANRLVQDYRGSPDATALLALVHYRFGRTAEAAACWRKCLDAKPDFAEAQQGLGAIALKAGQYAEAERRFRAAAEAAPKSTEAHVRLAETLMNLGRLAESVAALQKLRTIGPDTSESLCLLGQCHLQLQQFEAARKDFEAAIALDADCTYAYYGLANAWTRLGDQAKSQQSRARFQQLKDADQKAEKATLKAFDDLAAVRASVAFCRTAAGRVCLARGDLQKAADQWQKAAELDPRNADCRQELAALYQQTGRLPQSLQVLQQLVQLEPKNPLYLVHVGVLHAMLDQFDAAERSFLRAIEIGPQRPESHAALVQLYLRSNRKLPDAERLARTAAKLAPTAPNQAMLAAVCRANGHIEEARLAIKRAVELDPASSQYRELQQALDRKN